MKKSLRTLYCVAAFAAPTVVDTAYGHTVESAHEPTVRHGGTVKRAGPLNVEFVIDGACLLVYLYSNVDARLSSQGVNGAATVYGGGERYEVTLAADGGNRLRGCAAAQFSTQWTVFVRLETVAHGQISAMVRSSP